MNLKKMSFLNQWTKYSVLFWIGSSLALSETGWSGTKKRPLSQPEASSAPQKLAPEPPRGSQLTPSTPPQEKGVERYHLSYEKAEDEVINLFKDDVIHLEEKTQSTAVFQVTTTGFNSQSQQSKLKNKIERIIGISQKIAVKNCIACSQSKLVRTGTGELQYQSFTTDPSEVGKLAANLGVDGFIYGEMHYHPEEVALRIKLVEPKTQEIKWSKEYSTAQLLKQDHSPLLHDKGFGEIKGDDALAQLIAGESKFYLSPSVSLNWIPTMKEKGKNESQMTGPGLGVDILFGERFGLNKNIFAFVVGGAFTPQASAITKGIPIGGGIKLGVNYKRFLNPYSYRVPRFTLTGEIGGLTMIHFFIPYISGGVEMFMIRRFSLAIMPIFFLPTKINSSVLGEGTYGGRFGFQTRIGINF